MANTEFKKVGLFAYHEGEPDPDPAHPRPGTIEEGAGHIVYGLALDGVQVPLGRIKAGRYHRNKQRSEQAKSGEG
jgi:hypothetical protein